MHWSLCYREIVMFESRPSKTELEVRPETVLEEARRAYETRQRTQALERRLEKDQIEKPARDRDLASRIVDGLRRQKVDRTKIAALITAVGLAGCFQKGSDGQTINTEKLKQLEVLDRLAGNIERTYEKVTSEQRKELTKELGFDIVEIAHTANFDVSLQVPGKHDGYILHIGQAHYVHEVENEHESALQIIAVQKDIEKVLMLLSEKNCRKVFSESSIMVSDALEMHRQGMRDIASEIQADEQCFDKLSTACKEETDPYEGNHDFASNEMVMRIRNVFKKRALECRQELISQNQFSEDPRASFERALLEFGPTKKFSSFGEDAVYLMGAAEKLEYENIVSILPAELYEANKGTKILDPEIEKARLNFLNTDFSSLQPNEIEALARDYFQLVKIDNTFTFDVREDIAVKMIREHASSTPEKEILLPLIYGDAHDFGNNVIESNTKEAGADFGLIRLTPRKLK